MYQILYSVPVVQYEVFLYDMVVFLIILMGTISGDVNSQKGIPNYVLIYLLSYHSR